MNSESCQGYRSIIHIDMDAFYASVEMLDNPELRNKPVVVGGTSNRSVVSAASYEARKFGIHSAMPTVTARQLCPDAIFMPVRMSRYRELSSLIMDIFQQFTPLVEPISLDEAFLDVTGSEKLFGKGPEIAMSIRSLIRKETGLTASAGVASSKLVAKIASDLNKPDNMTIVKPGLERKFLAPLAIGKLWGVGRNTHRSLTMLSVQTIGDLANLPLELLTSKFGKLGQHLYYSSRGLDERPVVPAREAKSIGHEDTFSEDLKEMKEINKELLSLATRVGRRLRNHGKEGKTISVKVKFSDFSTNTRSLTLQDTTCDSQEIYQHARELLKKTEAGKRPLRLLGISVSNLAGNSGRLQQDLFGVSNIKDKRNRLNKAVDELNRKFGGELVTPAQLIKK